MRYKLLGRTGLRVSELCLGAMIFGDRRGGWGASKDEAAGIVERFAEAGGNFIDTANSYAGGESERIVGELVAAERERWVLSTKYTLSMRPDDPNGGGAHRKSLVQSLEASLRRLGTDYLDLYQCHRYDDETPLEETLRALDDLVRQGKVHYVGVSEWTAAQIGDALGLADVMFDGADFLERSDRRRVHLVACDQCERQPAVHRRRAHRRRPKGRRQCGYQVEGKAVVCGGGAAWARGAGQGRATAGRRSARPRGRCSPERHCALRTGGAARY